MNLCIEGIFDIELFVLFFFLIIRFRYNHKNIIFDLISCDYKMVIRKVLREHCMKQLIIFIKRKQYIAIKDWPGFKSNEGITIAQNIYLNTLKIIKLAAELNGITEGIVKSDFFFNLRNSFDIIQKEYFSITNSF